MTREEKTPYMVEWWHKANALLVEEKPHRDMLPDMVHIHFGFLLAPILSLEQPEWIFLNSRNSKSLASSFFHLIRFQFSRVTNP